MTKLTVRHSGCTAASRAANSGSLVERAHFEHLTAVAVPQPHRTQHGRRQYTLCAAVHGCIEISIRCVRVHLIYALLCCVVCAAHIYNKRCIYTIMTFRFVCVNSFVLDRQIIIKQVASVNYPRWTASHWPERSHSSPPTVSL